MDLFVSVAHIIKTRGVKGEVVADLLTDFPKRFASVRSVRVLRGDQVSDETLETYWFHRGRVILKFQGRETPEKAAPLVGGYVQVREEERFVPPRNTYYHSDLIGCRIEEEGQILGVVTGIFESGPDYANLVMRANNGNEVMIPLVKQFVKKVDIGAKIIRIKSLPGLF
ncbi:MAG: ribosome maturation factor RimM [Acidobacteriota bacterium]